MRAVQMLAAPWSLRQETMHNVFSIVPVSLLAVAILLLTTWPATGAEDQKLAEVDPSITRLKITREPLCPGEISSLQYGQFIEYLCNLVPSMWAEKLYDGSFEGLTPYKVVFLTQTDFREQPWYPSGAVKDPTIWPRGFPQRV
jgi:hypothetical protein